MCWYKEERPTTPVKDISAKSIADPDPKSKTDVIDNKTSHDEVISKHDSEPCNGKDAISLTTESSISKGNGEVEAVQGACIRLSGLTDSIQKAIATTHCSGSDRRNREPVVRLVPLSAEIKLKVHLDLDIRLDSDLKVKSCHQGKIKNITKIAVTIKMIIKTYDNNRYKK